MFSFKRFLQDTYDPERRDNVRKSRKFSLQPGFFTRKNSFTTRGHPQLGQRRSTLAGVPDDPKASKNDDKPILRRKKKGNLNSPAPNLLSELRSVSANFNLCSRIVGRFVE